MGQYWHLVNIDKREFVDPHKLGVGLKLWEQLAGHPGTGAALVVLLAAMPEPRGGGDLEPDPIIGHWVGDRVFFIGDYAEDGDAPFVPHAGTLYNTTNSGEYTDISEQVCAVIERELEGQFVGEGWRTFERT